MSEVIDITDEEAREILEAVIVEMNLPALPNREAERMLASGAAIIVVRLLMKALQAQGWRFQRPGH